MESVTPTTSPDATPPMLTRQILTRQEELSFFAEARDMTLYSIDESYSSCSTDSKTSSVASDVLSISDSDESEGEKRCVTG